MPKLATLARTMRLFRFGSLWVEAPIAMRGVAIAPNANVA
jgi:hypothetical protein